MNLGLSMSHRLNYDAAALTTQPPRLDKKESIIRVERKGLEMNDDFVLWGNKIYITLQTDLRPKR